MCGLYAYDKENDNSTDATNFGDVIPIPDDYNKFYLVSLCLSINFTYTWINVLENNSAWRYCAYQDKSK